MKQVPWYTVPDLVGGRRVFVRAGMAYVPQSLQISLVLQAFSTRLEKALEVRSKIAIDFAYAARSQRRTFPDWMRMSDWDRSSITSQLLSSPVSVRQTTNPPMESRPPSSPLRWSTTWLENTSHHVCGTFTTD